MASSLVRRSRSSLMPRRFYRNRADAPNLFTVGKLAKTLGFPAAPRLAFDLRYEFARTRDGAFWGFLSILCRRALGRFLTSGAAWREPRPRPARVGVCAGRAASFF